MIPFNDLSKQHESIADELKAAINRVVDSGRFVLGEEVETFENAFASYLGVSHCIGVASGTDAIQLALMGLGIGDGDEVITAANTCVPTIVGISTTGAIPVLADVDHATLTLDPGDVARAITPRTRAVVPVHLYGHPCDMNAISEVVTSTNIAIVEDCAQAHGSKHNDNLCGTLGECASFSFYPTKNVGALGDGGAVVTDDPDVADRIRAFHQYGRKTGYEHPSSGINSRLDEIQAAVLQVKLKYVNDSWKLRKTIAEAYDNQIVNDWVTPIATADWALTNHHLYVVRTPHRDALQKHLADKGIMTAVHYPEPIHAIEAYRDLGAPSAFPESERACAEVLSLPMYPGMRTSHVDAVIETINAYRP